MADMNTNASADDVALDIITDIDRRPITIDGVRYHLRDAAELSIVEQVEALRGAQRFQSMRDGDTDLADVDPETIAAIAADVRVQARRVLFDVPDHVFAAVHDDGRPRLTDEHCLLILATFSNAPARTKTPTAAQTSTASGPSVSWSPSSAAAIPGSHRAT